LKRVAYLVVAALVAMLILVPVALAQDTDPYSPEPNAVVTGSQEELQQIAGQPLPSQDPGQPPVEVPAAPPQGLPASGGPPVVILQAAALLLVGSGIVAYATLRRMGSR
jgi:hypothetical protein